MKKGQLQISFGMIFSIIIIIATIAIAVYVIIYFMNVQKCVNAGYLYEGLDKKIDGAWKGGIAREIVQLDAPAGIEKVCFGNLSQVATSEASSIYNELKNEPYLFRSNANVFLYPPGKACESALAYHKLNHARTDKFFCASVNKKGQINITIEKGVFDALVKIS